MDLALLKTFVTVAKTKNISRAAEQIHLSQPAVSLQIQQLESRIGQPLFLRHPLRLTDVGEHLLVNANAILAQWDETLAFVQSETELTTGKLTIACSDTVMRFCLLDVIEKFQSSFPKVSLSFLNRTSQTAQESVISGEADFAISLWQGDHPKLIHRKLFRYDECVLVSKAHQWADLSSITGHQLVKENLLLLEERTLSRQLIEQWFKSKQFSQPTVMSLGSVDAQIALARLGLGVAIVPKFSTPADLHSLNIKGLPLRQIACFYQRLKPAAQAWFRLMTDLRNHD